MFQDILLLIGGLILLVAGGNYLTDGAVSVAKRFNVSSLMIGLTVVALGSSMPDIAVCVESALEHKTAIAVGGVVGANIFDFLLVVGVMAVLRPWKISDMMRTQDLPLLFLSMTSLWIVADTVIFDGTATNTINRSAGLMLLSIFIIYMWLTVKSSKTQVITPASTQEHSVATAGAATAEASGTKAKGKQWLAWLMIVGGLVALVIGGDWVVDGASAIARKAGMSEGMVALTIVAIGNSLPDLVTSLTATLKGQPGLAFGNIVGACIINALLAIGISSAITPLGAGTVGFFDFMTLVGAALLLWAIPALNKSHRFNRLPGIFLIACYIAYMVLIIVRG
ncbi:MAG: calcium/sodium antiporter [Bacteroidales bacterium]|nr:calcium/sodium antiporter [Bacteroidales bacterium]